MASNDLGPAPQMVGAAAEDTIKGDVAVRNQSGELIVEDGKPVAPDQFEPKYETGKYELWAYYSYYIGNNVSMHRLGIIRYQLFTKSTQGLHLFNFAPTASQNLLAQHAAKIGGPDNEVVFFAGSNRTTNSIILLCNGISFAIQIAILLIIGAYADFGSFRPNILIVLSLIAFGIGFGWLGVHEEDQWQTGLGLYIVGLIAYQLCLTYWTAAFPGLARNTRALREQARKYEDGEVTREEYEFTDSMKRNEISNQAFYIQSLGEIVILAVIVGIMFGLRVNESDERNNWGLSVLIAFATGVWLLMAIPWFALEKRRPGQDPGMNIVIAGFWQLYRAITQIWQLKQSLFYLIGKSEDLQLTQKDTILNYYFCRLLPPWRLAKHNCHRNRNPTKLHRGVQHPRPHLPPHCRDRRPSRGNLRLLAHPETLPPLHQDDVQRRSRRNHPARRMGNGRNLDAEVRLPQCLGR
jgi:hypothetical protein